VPYSVFVVEIDDVCPRNESGLPNVITLVTVSSTAERYQRLASGRSGPEWVHSHLVGIRKDLSLTKTYETLNSAKKAERRLASRLMRQGFIVNRRTDHRRVYVIELDDSHLVRKGKGYLYIGETSETPEVRFQKHRDGAVNKHGGSIASRYVQQHGKRLRPDLAPKEFFLTKIESELAEAECRKKLEAQGYRCEGAHLVKRESSPI
jgi:hypothetical protein